MAGSGTVPEPAQNPPNLASMVKDFFDSLSAYGKAIGMISKHRLWSYIVIPGLVSVVVMGLLIIGPAAWFANSSIETWLVNAVPWDWAKGVTEWVADGIAFILSMLVVLFLGKYIVLIVVSPFMGGLSEKIETIITGRKVPSDNNFFLDLMRGIRISLRNLVRELFFTLIFLFFNLIPIVGTIVGTVLTFAVESYYAGFGNMDYTLERKRFTVSQSVAFVSQNRGIAMGNGIVFVGLLLIPVVGWFLAPAFSTIAATTMVIRRLEKAPLNA